MPHKNFVFTVIILVVVIVSILLLSRKIGDIRPAVFPPKKNDIVLKGENIPISINDQRVVTFAQDLDRPRDLEFSPEGTLFASIPSKGKIVALPDQNNDGKADETKTILEGLRHPHGIAFYSGKLFVALEDRVERYRWDEKNLTASFDKKLFNIPTGGSGHITRSVVFDKGGRMFVTIGSTCNVCNEGAPFLASIIVSDNEGITPRIFAKGLRNSVFLAINPKTDQLWATEMGRDFLGDDLPPDEVNIILDGRDYGWPRCWGQAVHDTQFDKNPNDPCTHTQEPVFEIPAHSAPLGLAFIGSKQFPPDWQGDLLVAYHGSWNRSAPAGYKVVRLVTKSDKVIKQEDLITGFLDGPQAIGRPVDLIFDAEGSLFLSDDKSGKIYKLQNIFNL